MKRKSNSIVNQAMQNMSIILNTSVPMHTVYSKSSSGSISDPLSIGLLAFFVLLVLLLGQNCSSGMLARSRFKIDNTITSIEAMKKTCNRMLMMRGAGWAKIRGLSKRSAVQNIIHLPK